MAKIPSVDKEACISCGLCISICPGVFRFGKDAKAEAYNTEGADKLKIQEAVDGCPVQCISWQ